MSTKIKPGTVVYNKMTAEPAFVLDSFKAPTIYPSLSGDMLTLRRAVQLEDGGLQYLVATFHLEEYDTQESIKQKALDDYLAFEAGKEAAATHRETLPAVSH